MTPLTPEFIQAKSILKSHPVPGGGGQASGYVTLRTWGEQWVTHFYDIQTGGFNSGRYWDTLSDAENSFSVRVKGFEQHLPTFAHY
jgi:hypothetical protein